MLRDSIAHFRVGLQILVQFYNKRNEYGFAFSRVPYNHYMRDFVSLGLNK